MRAGPVLILLCLSLLAVFAPTSRAFADDDRDDAEKSMVRGSDAMARGEFKDAVLFFRTAHKLKPTSSGRRHHGEDIIVARQRIRSKDMQGVAREYSEALNREVTYADIPPDRWEAQLKTLGLPEHLTRHLVTMAELNRAGRYDRMTDGVERLTGRPPMSVREFVSLHADEFGGRSAASADVGSPPA